MKRYQSILLVGLIIIVLVLGVLLYNKFISKKEFNREKFCFINVQGMHAFNGIECICDGELIHSTCPFGTLCEATTYYCEGEILGYSFSYNDKKFETLDEFESYCESLNLEDKDLCLNFLNNINKILSKEN